ncbi:MAG TPA: tRNA1(Val) (adenine(37)-N6)-methyltransferase, partial [Bacillota bacterium]|nr:tRNA1(Val) (adenine(37)-N6)-methyltransferase [Bacillota bacterium]
DELQRGGLSVIQSDDHFPFSIDAVLLAHFATLRLRDRVVDLGTGCAVIPLIMSTRSPHAIVTGLELSPAAADMATRSIRLNRLENRISILQGDIREVRNTMPVGSVDLVTANPPYLPIGTGDISPADGRSMARHELYCTLDDVIKAAGWLLRTGGKFALVHRPERLAEIISLCAAVRLEPKRMRLVHPMRGRDANIVLLEAVKNGKPGMRVEPVIYVHRSDGTYTEEIVTLYGGGTLA